LPGRLVAALLELQKQVGVRQQRTGDRDHVALAGQERAVDDAAALEATVGDDRNGYRLLNLGGIVRIGRLLLTPPVTDDGLAKELRNGVVDDRAALCLPAEIARGIDEVV